MQRLEEGQEVFQVIEPQREAYLGLRMDKMAQ